MDTEAIAWAVSKLQAFGIGDSMGSAMMMDRLHLMLAAAPTPPATCNFPVIGALFETVENGITGTTEAPVKRIEFQDDGSYTVIIDHWPTPPAQEDEPVAVIDESDDGKFADLTEAGTILKIGTRLYTRTQFDELRKAAEEILAIAEGKGRTDMYVRTIEKLRAALRENYGIPSETQ